MEELRVMCEIITRSLSDTEWMLKLLKDQDVLVKRYDAGCDRERILVLEKVSEV